MRKLTPEESIVAKQRDRERVRKWVEANRERRREISRLSTNRNRHKHLERDKARRLINLPRYRANAMVRYYKNHAKTLELIRKQRAKNPEPYRAALRRRDAKNKALRNNAWLASKIRNRVRFVMLGKIKSAPTLVLLGCPLDLFRLHLQNQFRDGMAWNNYGTYWHIDHIRPCASFDLSKPEEQAKCFHYSNLQPLTAFENKSKGAKYVA